jgi:uncharacterized membrane protein
LKKSKKTLYLARAGIITALYVALTYACMPLAYGTIQVRIGEALTVLPLLYAESVPALFIGCALANIGSPFGFYDICIGSVVSLAAAFVTYLIGKFVKNKVLKIILGGLPPIIFNAALLPLMWLLFCNDAAYVANMLSILATQSIFVYGLGTPLYLALAKLKEKGVKGFD